MTGHAAFCWGIFCGKHCVYWRECYVASLYNWSIFFPCYVFIDSPKYIQSCPFVIDLPSSQTLRQLPLRGLSGSQEFHKPSRSSLACVTAVPDFISISKIGELQNKKCVFRRWSVIWTCSTPIGNLSQSGIVSERGQNKKTNWTK